MKRFRFRLQTALEMRQRKEEQLQVELAALHLRRQQEAERLDRFHAARKHAMNQARSERIGPFRFEDSQAKELYLTDLEKAIATQETLVRMVEGDMARKSQELTVAVMETKALVNLRDQHAEAYRRDELREEQKFLDETATLRATRLGAGVA